MTYEHDWYASKKTVVNDCASYNAEVRMKFSNEWYFKECGNQVMGEWPIDPLNVFLFHHIFSNEKCMFDFRIQE